MPKPSFQIQQSIGNYIFLPQKHVLINYSVTNYMKYASHKMRYISFFLSVFPSFFLSLVHWWILKRVRSTDPSSFFKYQNDWYQFLNIRKKTKKKTKTKKKSAFRCVKNPIFFLSYHDIYVWFWFYGLWTIVGYVMPNSFLHIDIWFLNIFVDNIFKRAWAHFFTLSDGSTHIPMIKLFYFQ